MPQRQEPGEGASRQPQAGEEQRREAAGGGAGEDNCTCTEVESKMGGDPSTGPNDKIGGVSAAWSVHRAVQCPFGR